MADEKTTTAKPDDATEPAADTSTSGEPEAATTAEPDDATGPAGPEGGPVPGDPSSEPVATAAQSWVEGRVGPPSIQQDATAAHHTGEGVEQIAPGETKPADTVIQGGPVAFAQADPATFGAGPYGAATPAPDAPNVVSQTVPGKGGAVAEELPQGTPLASDTSAQGGPVTIPAAASGGSAESPASSSGSTSTPSQTDSAGTSEPAESAPTTSG